MSKKSKNSPWETFLALIVILCVILGAQAGSWGWGLVVGLVIVVALEMKFNPSRKEQEHISPSSSTSSKVRAKNKKYTATVDINLEDYLSEEGYRKIEKMAEQEEHKSYKLRSDEAREQAEIKAAALYEVLEELGDMPYKMQYIPYGDPDIDMSSEEIRMAHKILPIKEYEANKANYNKLPGDWEELTIMGGGSWMPEELDYPEHRDDLLEARAVIEDQTRTVDDKIEALNPVLEKIASHLKRRHVQYKTGRDYYQSLISEEIGYSINIVEALWEMGIRKPEDLKGLNVDKLEIKGLGPKTRDSLKEYIERLC